VFTARYGLSTNKISVNQSERYVKHRNSCTFNAISYSQRPQQQLCLCCKRAFDVTLNKDCLALNFATHLFVLSGYSKYGPLALPHTRLTREVFNKDVVLIHC